MKAVFLFKFQALRLAFETALLQDDFRGFILILSELSLSIQLIVM